MEKVHRMVFVCMGPFLVRIHRNKLATHLYILINLHRCKLKNRWKCFASAAFFFISSPNLKIWKVAHSHTHTRCFVWTQWRQIVSYRLHQRDNIDRSSTWLFSARWHIGHVTCVPNYGHTILHLDRAYYTLLFFFLVEEDVNWNSFFLGEEIKILDVEFADASVSMSETWLWGE